MKASSSFGSVEPLEARIAPARIIYVGDATDSASIEYSDPDFFVKSGGADFLSAAVGGDDRSYYLKLTAGDQVWFRGGSGYEKVISISKGTAIVFFHDKGDLGTGLDEVSVSEIQGVSLSPGASATFLADINGDVLTNYDPVSNQVKMTDVLGAKATINGLSASNINGSVFAGGNITGITANSVENILAGTAGHAKTFDLLPDATGVGEGEGMLSVTAADGQVGASISKIQLVTLGSASSPVGVIAAGGGGAGAKGGFVNQVVIQSDSNGFSILGGSGGDGAGTKLNGGMGGDISNIYIAGTADLTLNDSIQILSGNGGDGAAGGNGGAGGKLTNVMVGYTYTKTAIPSSALSKDNILIASGEGGDGKTGGAGGALSKVSVLTITPDAAGDEVIIRAGTGGDAVSTLGGAAGLGGSITGVKVENKDTTSFNSSILIQAGDGGTVMPAAKTVANGALGGSITDVNVLGFNVALHAGDGSDGKVGGKGGSLTKLRPLQSGDIMIHSLDIEAGRGGSSESGAGGAGGKVSDLRFDESDLTGLTINAAGGGAGGASNKGKGGDGGAVTLIDIADGDSGFLLAGTIDIRSGSGGNGTSGGGKGGEVSKMVLSGEDVEVTIAAGSGGNATSEGAGGAGGIVNTVTVSAVGLLNGLPVNGTISAGAGGEGKGKGAGGLGADVKSVDLNVDGSVLVQAGQGGNSDATGTAGRGGSILTVRGNGVQGSGEFRAGDAGTGGGKAAHGGSILGTSAKISSLSAAEGVQILAGDGSSGGNGGDIKYMGFGATSNGAITTPTGTVLVQAGNGSGLGTVAGKGGSIDRLDGAPSSGVNQTTSIIAGNGGSTATKGGVGGSVTNLSLTGQGNDNLQNPVTIIIEAGNAGASPTAGAGVKGGDVKTVAISNLDSDTIVQRIAAGDGGTAFKKGGLGGTIDNVRVLGGTDGGVKLSGDIGYRSGKDFGYLSMGGLFAGAGGDALDGVAGVDGLAGNVTNISADSIAAIVAGRDTVPELVEKVEKIILNDLKGLKPTGPSPFSIIYNPQGDPLKDGDDPQTIVLGTDGRIVDPEDVEAALNALVGVTNGLPAPVDVVRTTGNSFQITGSTMVDLADFVAFEHVAIHVSESISGFQRITVEEVVVGSSAGNEVQFFKPFANGNFQLTFNGNSTGNMDVSLTDFNTLDTALNLLPSVIAAGGVTVTGDNVTGYTITFDDPGARTSFIGTANVQEVQIIDPLGEGRFRIRTSAGETDLLAANASAGDVESAIDGIVGGPTVSVVAGPNGSYIVTFDDPGNQPMITGTEYIEMAANELTAGSGSAKEVVGISFVSRATFSMADYNNANIVGAIADPNEIGAPTFKYDDTVVDGAFVGGEDTPIDGIIMARILNQGTLNFTPQAKYVTTDNGKPLTGPAFFDFDNKI